MYRLTTVIYLSTRLPIDYHGLKTRRLNAAHSKLPITQICTSFGLDKERKRVLPNRHSNVFSKDVSLLFFG